MSRGRAGEGKVQGRCRALPPRGIFAITDPRANVNVGLTRGLHLSNNHYLDHINSKNCYIVYTPLGNKFNYNMMHSYIFDPVKFE